MSERREWALALAVAWVLVAVRSAVFVVYEQSYFDADQAIVGLMAKHLAEGRALPLFFYGQSYMLGVEAWLAAPWLWLFGPTVASLRLSLVALNLATVTLMITTLWRAVGLRPWHGLAATLCFAIAPPFTSALLLEAQGGSIEPFVYVTVLWWLRRRPLWFGALLGIGFLNREFTAYAVPVILLGQALTGRLWRPQAIRAWVLASVSFCAVWEGVNSLKPYADLMGPGTRGQLLGGFAGSQLADVSSRTSLSFSELPVRLVATVSQLFALLVNGAALGGNVPQGHNWLWWPLMIGLGAAALRLAWLVWRGGAPTAERVAFCAYLCGVGVLATVAYAATHVPDDGTMRYLLLMLLVPIGLVGGVLAIESNVRVRIGVIAMVLVWGVTAAIDTGAFIRHYASGTVPNEMREVADALEARGLTVAEADYWRAYKLSFLTEERVRFASTDVVRIAEYQALAVRAGESLRRLELSPCAGGEPIGRFFLCPAPR